MDSEKAHDTHSEGEQQAKPGIRSFYYHPLFQTCMLGFVCFMCPGMFNALSGLGGGGQVDSQTASNANSALYATFAFFSFFSGSINNKLGPPLTLFIGTIGYALFIGSFLTDNIHPTAGPFVVAAGAILGICAAFLWTAQGSLMLSYPTEAEKGKYIAIFWAIFNLGGVVGAAVSLGQNFHSVANADGTKVECFRNPTWKTEIMGLWVALRTDPMILLLFPMFYASNYFYTWQFNDYNQALFDIRARSMNNFVYWLSQIVGSLAIGNLVLDQVKFSRRSRAFAGWAILFVMVFIVNIWGYFYQKTYTRESVKSTTQKMDIYDKGYPAHVWLMIFCGLFDAMWQTTVYWLMGAMSNDPAKLAVFTGFYKSIQSAGAAGVWRADATGIPFMNIFLSSWCLTTFGLVCALPMIYLRVKEHTELADETLARMDDTGRVRELRELKGK
ncbi:hypothetical protein ID866_7369 [Astraeus odoratus]|nr:hypothetical protein ID866_7369 [Astraeus odoratus]